jgi:cell division protein FtsQ
MADRKLIGKWIITAVWLLIAAGTVVLLVAANNKGKQQLCTGMEVTIQGVSRHCFLDEKDILATITEYIEGGPKGQPVSSFDLLAMEAELRKNVWVSKIEMYFDNNQVLQVNVHEREPVARVFTVSGGSFYVDSSRMILPLSEKYAVRLPVFTGFPSDRRVLSSADSNLLADVIAVSNCIRSNDFRMAFVEQVNIGPQLDFQLVPKMGNGIINLGAAVNLEEKFNNLLVFYRKVLVGNQAWDRYSSIDLRFNNQVVARRRDATDVLADSVAKEKIYQAIEAYARKLASDTLQALMNELGNSNEGNSIVLESFERNESDFGDTSVFIPGIAPLVRPMNIDKKGNAKKANSVNRTGQSATPVKPVPYPMKKSTKSAVTSKGVGRKPVKPVPGASIPGKQKTGVAKPSNDYR